MWKRYVLAGLVVAYAFGTWSAYRGEHDAPVADALVFEGMATWQAQNCVACHQLFGLGGYLGPDLTNVISDAGDARVRTFVKYGSGRMPAHPMSAEELDGLVAFLAWVDATGTSRVPEHAVHWTGTYVLDP